MSGTAPCELLSTGPGSNWTRNYPQSQITKSEKKTSYMSLILITRNAVCAGVRQRRPTPALVTLAARLPGPENV